MTSSDRRVREPDIETSEEDPIIVAASRSAFGRENGLFRYRTAPQLAAPVLRTVLGSLSQSGTAIDEVILGNVLAGGNVARAVALEANLPVDVPAVTVDRQCGSGLEAILDAAWRIRAGTAQCIVAGGVESTSTAPWRVEKPAHAGALPRFVTQAPFSGGRYADPSMIEGAENAARLLAVSRQDQDTYAAWSHQKACLAQAEGEFDRELTVIEGEADRDECPKPGMTPARLARLKPLSGADGTVTIGNACPINDGAAILLVVSRRYARTLGATAGLRVIHGAAAGCDPATPGLGAIAATRRLMGSLSSGGWVDGIPDWVTQVEFNEAFAGQTLACLRALGLSDRDGRVCPKGGALALGHPYGASGAALVVRLFHDLSCQPHPMPFGLAILGIAGGLGVAGLFRWESFLSDGRTSAG